MGGSQPDSAPHLPTTRVPEDSRPQRARVRALVRLQIRRITALTVKVDAGPFPPPEPTSGHPLSPSPGRRAPRHLRPPTSKYFRHNELFSFLGVKVPAPFDSARMPGGDA